MMEMSWLRKKRFEAGFRTCADLAKQLVPDVTGEAVRKWETMTSSPRKYYCPQLIKLLHVTKEELYEYIAEVDQKLYEERNGLRSNSLEQLDEEEQTTLIKDPSGDLMTITVAERMFLLDNKKKGGDKRLLRLMQQD